MGADRVWPAEQLITYSYAALQNWARESEEGSPQTPREFCREVGRELPEAAEALEHLAFLYGHVAYGGTVPVGYDPERLRLLWQYLGSPKPKRAEVPTNSTVAI